MYFPKIASSPAPGTVQSGSALAHGAARPRCLLFRDRLAANRTQQRWRCLTPQPLPLLLGSRGTLAVGILSDWHGEILPLLRPAPEEAQATWRGPIQVFSPLLQSTASIGHQQVKGDTSK